MSSASPRNRLAGESSPYLQQHANNPVAWYPWGEEALAAAKAEDKPILLSIGYSACHWCHVMAHESFEDAETAQVMNRHFVNIKVDREERPDLDRIYQHAHRLLVGRGGGWPLTMFLTPAQIPFFGGTYFPPQPRHGLPAFTDLLTQVAEFYHRERGRIEEQNQALLAAFATGVAQMAGRLEDAPLAAARAQLAAAFDAANGGFGKAPKFPHASELELLLRLADRESREMLLRTLRAMADGGIHDQLGGGFFRYAVDERWAIPHFEKMLYDNGPLLALYADAWRLSGSTPLREVAEGIGEWVMREMQSPEGGYYATLDADSGGREGGYYLWEREEVEGLLAHDEYQAFALRFGLDQHANFEGAWHLLVTAPVAGIAAALGTGEERVRALLGSARTQLFARRRQRPLPGRDEKVLTAWNGLMIRGMARAGRRLRRDDFLASAERALDFIHTHLYHDGRLLAAYKGGQARLPGYLDDYAFLIDAILELLQARWRGGDLRLAVELADTLLEHFEDGRHGGFFFTADDHEALIQRPKPLSDESTPAGNGVAAAALLRLGHLLGERRYLEAAERTLRGAWAAIGELPYAHASLLLALDELLHPRETVILRGGPARLRPWLDRIEEAFTPGRMVLTVPDDAPDLPPSLAAKAPRDTPVAYICRGESCAQPVTAIEGLEAALARPA